MRRAAGGLVALLMGAWVGLAGCDEPSTSSDGGAADAGGPAPVASLRFDLSGGLDTAATFFDFPFPSDLRLDPDGTPNLTGYPNPGVLQLVDVLALADERPGWPTIPVGYFGFGAPLASRSLDDRFDASPDSAVILIDVDPGSPDRGQMYSTIATTFAEDAYTGEHLLGVAAYPGIVLHAGRTYAFVVRRSFGDAEGRPLPVDGALAQLAAGEVPAGDRGADAATLYAPLFETLDEVGVPREEVAAATVFTTGDVVAETRALSDRVLDRYDVTIEGLAIDPTDGASHERYCELLGTVSQPQFQVGTPPFDRDGRFDIGDDGLPVHQRDEDTVIVITLPKTEMPAEGYPLMVYMHGSGGVAAQVVDRGPIPEGGVEAVGEGPADMIAAHEFAAVGSSLPLSPDRLPGASDIAYLNLNNLGAFRDTFRQGVIEQRLLIEALRSLRIDPSALAGCDGPTLPVGETAFRFDPDAFVALGQSMGGMYVNVTGAVEPSLSALVPTGAGGFWSFFILETELIAGIRGLLSIVLRVDEDDISHLHPAMALLELGWEAAEPMVSMPRLSRRPLPGIGARPIYEPVGLGDSFFPSKVYDAVVLAYGHPQAGEVVWSSMQDSLAVAGLDGVRSYPVSQNLVSETGEPYTGIVVQHAGDGFSDPHTIFTQIEDIRYQWGCFLRTAVDGTAVVPAPAALGTPCPTE